MGWTTPEAIWVEDLTILKNPSKLDCYKEIE
jgi:hypothetical protein